MPDDIKPILTPAERRTLLVRSNHPRVDTDRLTYLIEITEQAVAEKLAVLADREGRQPSPWKPLTGAGQIQPGDYISLTSGGAFIVAKALRVLRAGASNEEVVYNLRQNHYFITQMAVDGTSHAKGVMFAPAGAQLSKEE